jgi:hypothetical protein
MLYVDPKQYDYSIHEKTFFKNALRKILIDKNLIEPDVILIPELANIVNEYANDDTRAYFYGGGGGKKKRKSFIRKSKKKKYATRKKIVKKSRGKKNKN